MQLMINTRGSLLRCSGKRFIVSRDGKSYPFAAEKVTSIVVCTSVRVTSNAIALASQANVDIVFLNSQGAPHARVWQPRLGSTATIRRRQLEASTGSQGNEIAIAWIRKKLQNQSEFLRQLALRRSDRADQIRCKADLIDTQIDALSRLDPATPIRDSVMGIEGTVGRVYFELISRLMPAEYRFTGRNRRPATDGFNAMLNYTFGVLYSIVERACILAGLDPHIGFLHTDNYNKPSLVFDLIEPFRIIGERTTVLFFTGRRVKAEFFRPVPGGIELAAEGRAAVIANLNERLDKAVRYPVQRSKQRGAQKYRRIKLRTTIQYEAHSLANRLLGKHDLPKIVDSQALFSGTD